MKLNEKKKKLKCKLSLFMCLLRANNFCPSILECTVIEKYKQELKIVIS